MNVHSIEVFELTSVLNPGSLSGVYSDRDPGSVVGSTVTGAQRQRAHPTHISRMSTCCALHYKRERLPVSTHDLLAFAGTLTGSFGYLGIAVVLIVAAPELVLPLAGFWVAQGELAFAPVLLASVAGAMVGQVVIYAAARSLGERRVRGFLERYGRWLFTSEADLDRGLRLFSRHRTLVVTLGRAVPTVRSLISVPAGLEPMPPGQFLLLTMLGTALWNALLLLAGTLLGQNWQSLAALLETYGTVILGLLGLGVCALLARRLRARAVRSRSR